MLEEGKIDIGLVEGNAARPALEGVGRTQANLAVLSVMYSNPDMFAVVADSPNLQIEDLEGKPIAFGTHASGLRTLKSSRIATDMPPPTAIPADGIGCIRRTDFQGGNAATL